ncbi:MAG: hypothetical protein AABW50_04935 [Nanoarchaeota archaeon]|mgnify:CR=1 FL=1
MLGNIFKIIGALGLFLILIGIIKKNRKKQDYFYITGGILLLVYSIYIKDIIFVILQSVFTIAAVYDLKKRK